MLLCKDERFDFVIGTQMFDYADYHPNVATSSKPDLFSVCSYMTKHELDDTNFYGSISLNVFAAYAAQKKKLTASHFLGLELIEKG